MRDEQKGSITLAPPELGLGIPLIIRSPYPPDYGQFYHFEKTVLQTEGWTGRKSDRFGNNFGVGDIVLYDSRWKKDDGKRRRAKPEEGTVTSIYQYCVTHGSERKRKIVARVNFGKKGEMLIPSELLQAITNEHVIFNPNTLEKFTELKDVVSTSNPVEVPELKPVFDDPVARAIWIAYRKSHIMHDELLRVLNESSLRIANLLRETPIPKNRLALWFQRNMPPVIKVSEQFAVFMVPYLTGEKEATYIVQPPQTA